MEQVFAASPVVSRPLLRTEELYDLLTEHESQLQMVQFQLEMAKSEEERKALGDKLEVLHNSFENSLHGWLRGERPRQLGNVFMLILRMNADPEKVKLAYIVATDMDEAKKKCESLYPVDSFIYVETEQVKSIMSASNVWG